jgi:cytolysin-activating lysine-acyltransferase
VSPADDTRPQGAEALRERLETYGALAFLAAHCPRHRDWSAAELHALFAPAADRGFLRVFRNAEGTPCAVLLWARLSPEVARALAEEGRPLAPQDWTSGRELWFVDLIAPFGHGAQVARSIARRPPPEPFRFARLRPDGRAAKVVAADPARRSVRALWPEPG